MNLSYSKAYPSSDDKLRYYLKPICLNFFGPLVSIPIVIVRDEAGRHYEFFTKTEFIYRNSGLLIPDTGIYYTSPDDNGPSLYHISPSEALKELQPFMKKQKECETNMQIAIRRAKSDYRRKVDEENAKKQQNKSAADILESYWKK